MTHCPLTGERKSHWGLFPIWEAQIFSIRFLWFYRCSSSKQLIWKKEKGGGILRKQEDVLWKKGDDAFEWSRTAAKAGKTPPELCFRFSNLVHLLQFWFWTNIVVIQRSLWTELSQRTQCWKNTQILQSRSLVCSTSSSFIGNKVQKERIFCLFLRFVRIYLVSFDALRRLFVQFRSLLVVARDGKGRE